MEYNIQPRPLLSKYCDVSVVTFDTSKNIKIIHAHKIVLASNSRFFDQIFESDKNNGNNFVCHIDIPTKTMEDVLELIYNKHVIINQEDVEGFRQALKKLDIKVLSNSYDTQSIDTKKHKVIKESLKISSNPAAANVKTNTEPVISAPKIMIDDNVQDTFETSEKEVQKTEIKPIISSLKVKTDTKVQQTFKTSPKQSRKTDARQLTFEEVVEKKKFKSDPQPEKNKKVTVDSISETTLDDDDLDNIEFQLNPKKGNRYLCKHCSFTAASFFEATNHYNVHHRPAEYKEKTTIRKAKDFQEECQKFLKENLKSDQIDKNKEKIEEYAKQINRWILILKGINDGKLDQNLRFIKEGLLVWLEKKIKTINDKIK